MNKPGFVIRHSSLALALSFAELTGRFRTHAVIATLQCAGNRRTGFN